MWNGLVENSRREIDESGFFLWSPMRHAISPGASPRPRFSEMKGQRRLEWRAEEGKKRMIRGVG